MTMSPASESASPSPKILVVGAGPSGLVMALSLVRNGVPVRIIDQETSSRLGQRGAGIMPRSLELFHALGVSDDILRRAIPAPQAVMYEMPAGVAVLSKFDMWPPAAATPQCPFPNVLMLGQDHLEQILRAELRRRGCEVEWGATLRGFEQRPGEECVRATIARPAHGPEGLVEETQTYEYLVGTDGARGVVRKALGLSFLGETSNAHNLVVGDVMVHGLDPKLWHIWGDLTEQWLSLRPTEVPFMYSFLLSGAEIDHTYVVEHPQTLSAKFVEFTGGRRKDLMFGDVVWLSTYRPSVRMVNKFHVGRVFVAGDSGHVHSVTGGQGMNTGIQDSFNLGWKLGLVARKLGHPSLLETYTEERAPVIAAMLNQTKALLKETWGNNDANSDSHLLVRSSASTASAWKYNGGVLQLGVNCRWSSIVLDEQRGEADDYLDDFDEDGFPPDDEEEEEEELSPAMLLDRPLCAGDRAPDAPGLTILRRRMPPEKRSDDAHASRTTSLFNTFLASSHTVLVFSNDPNRLVSVVRHLSAYSQDIVQTAVVLRPHAHGSSSGQAAASHALADWVLEDHAGHAYRAYALRERCDVVVVRPDGLIGAIVSSNEGLRRYLRAVFVRDSR